MAAADATVPGRSGDRRNYALVTGAYWADTIADGAIRVLVLFYFYDRGYTAFEVASLFLFYELFGILTNLFGGWLATRFGLKSTLVAGLAIQLCALGMLALAPDPWLVVPFVMAAQALSGIAKDLTKMSSKTAVRFVAPKDSPATLFRWVAVLTGSKNAVKGVGFFVGGVLLTVVGFQTALLILAGLVLMALLVVVSLMRGDLGHPSSKARFTQMFSNSRAVNILAAARVFLFASRDVWFVVGLPVFLNTELGWSFWQVGAFLAAWVIGYGIVQASAPGLLGRRSAGDRAHPDGSDRDLARLPSRRVPRRDRRRAHARRRSDDRPRRRPDRLRHRLRAQLGRPLLPDPVVRRQRAGRDERGLLLHGERGRATHRHHSLGRALPVAGPRGVPLGLGGVRPRSRVAFAAASVQGRRRIRPPASGIEAHRG